MLPFSVVFNWIVWVEVIPMGVVSLCACFVVIGQILLMRQVLVWRITYQKSRYKARVTKDLCSIVITGVKRYLNTKPERHISSMIKFSSYDSAFLWMNLVKIGTCLCIQPQTTLMLKRALDFNGSYGKYPLKFPTRKTGRKFDCLISPGCQNTL